MPLSLAGRVQSVKMAILPQMFFKTIDQLESDFIWGYKVSRISKTILQKKRTEGGLALPNFLYYYWGANIHKINHWLQAPDTNRSVLETQSCRSSYLSALVFSSLPLSPSCYSSNPIVLSTLKNLDSVPTPFQVLLPIHTSPYYE